MDAIIADIAMLSRELKQRVESLDRANIENRKVVGCHEFSSTDRTRISFTTGLKRHLKGVMGDFQSLRQQLHGEYREIIERRYFAVMGKQADEETIDRLAETGESIIFPNIVGQQGRGQVVDTLAEIQERHSTIKDVEKQLLELQQIFGDISMPGETGEPLDNDLRTPKKRAETWGQDEIRALISLRREMDKQFNTSKSNKHLWEQISVRMKEHGYDRSATMCTDKWRNLLKEYKKAKHQDDGAGIPKVACFKDLDALLGDRPKMPYRVTSVKCEPAETYLKLPKGEPTVSRDCNRSASPGSLEGRTITVRLGENLRRIGIEGPSEAIKETIKAVFRLRSKRPFWLVDDAGIVWTISPDMPKTNYTLQQDEGVTVKVCVYDDQDGMTAASEEEKTLYTDDDFQNYLKRKRWGGLREMGSSRHIGSIEELQPGAIYQHIDERND
eukprot:TRINITY_DN1199_c0_g2_i1.p1 TRINITY_DN1199_c0_g2~~TRINITY_DN1199_c0_g2_i1.p1  ORF type:complete len:456 (-),score=89.29 TRINITY_DN1199_c0_g2_i1:201-1529(-)